MSNPFSRAAAATFPKGPAQATDNLTSLPSGQAKGLGSIAGSAGGSPYADIHVGAVQIKTNAAGVSSTGTVSLYVVTSVDGTVYDGAIDPDSTSDQSSKLAQATQVQTMDANTNAGTYAFRSFSVFAKLGYVPEHFAVVVMNETGAALDGTAASFSAKYELESYV